MRLLPKTAIMFLATVLLSAESCQTANEQSATFLITVIETGTLDKLGPAGDAVAVLKNLPEISKVALAAHIRRRMIEDPDESKEDWRQANLSCITSGACGRLAALQRQRSRSVRRSGARPNEQPIQLGGEGGEGGGDGH